MRAAREESIRKEPPVDTGNLNQAMGAGERIMPKLPTSTDQLLLAVREGDRKRVERWTEGGARLGEGNAVLVAAVRGRGGDDFVRWLTAQGASLDEPDPSGRTPLSWAAGGGRLELVRFLLSRGADRDSVDQLGRSPIHHAVFGGDVQVVNALIEAGAPVNTQDNLGTTPLMYACAKDLRDVVILLDQSGASWEVLDKLGRTAAQRSHAADTPCVQ